MIWADKIALAWLALIVLVLSALSSEPSKVFTTLFEPHLWAGTWIPILRLVLIPWIILRMLDWAFGGPKRRAKL